MRAGSELASHRVRDATLSLSSDQNRLNFLSLTLLSVAPQVNVGPLSH